MKFYVVKVNNLIKYAFLAVIVLAVSFFVYFPGRRCRCISTKREIPFILWIIPKRKLPLPLTAPGGVRYTGHSDTLREHDVKATFFIIGVGLRKIPMR